MGVASRFAAGGNKWYKKTGKDRITRKTIKGKQIEGTLGKDQKKR